MRLCWGDRAAAVVLEDSPEEVRSAAAALAGLRGRRPCFGSPEHEHRRSGGAVSDVGYIPNLAWRSVSLFQRQDAALTQVSNLTQ